IALANFRREVNMRIRIFSFFVFVALLTAFSPDRSFAQISDRSLLLLFCDAGDINGTSCGNAKNYRQEDGNDRRCSVELEGTRFTGRFVSSLTTVLVAGYTSDCEPHATEWGGSVVFEREGNQFLFKGYRPGLRPRECISIPKSTQQDRL